MKPSKALDFRLHKIDGNMVFQTFYESTKDYTLKKSSARRLHRG